MWLRSGKTKKLISDELGFKKALLDLNKYSNKMCVSVLVNTILYIVLLCVKSP